MTDEVNALLNLTRSTVVTFDVGGAAAAPLSISVPIDGDLYTLDLAPYSVRSEAYEVKAQLADGSYMNVEPGPIRTLRGTVVGIEGSVVAASLSDDGLHARIILPDDATYWIEPLGSRLRAAALNEHVVYRGDDVVPGGGTCIALHTNAAAEATFAEPGGVATGGPLVAELAIDADYEYFQEFQGREDPLAATEAWINDIINSMNVQYERDVGISHFITTIIVRTAEPDPYRGVCLGGSSAGDRCDGGGDCPGGGCVFDAEDLLHQFREHWRSKQSGVHRDVAQLFTGKRLYGNVIGIAWMRSVCSTFTGYSVVESNCSLRCGSFACKTDLSAHELGHSWGAQHCGYDGPDDEFPCSPSCPGWTMNCSLTCANQFHETYTIPEIIAHRDGRTCLCKEGLRRIILFSEGTTVEEGNTLQFNATADFRCGEGLDVTTETIWSVDRPEAGWIDSNGLFRAFDVDGDACITVSALYLFNGTEYTRDKIITVIDTDAPQGIVANLPPDGAVDARQPFEPDGSNPAGWRSIDITFNGDLCQPTAADFDVSTVTQDGGVEPGPAIANVERVGTGLRTVRLLLSEVTEPGAWTTVTHVGSGASIQVGYLPGDVDANGTAAPDDILALIDALNGVGEPPPIWSTDIDRSGLTTAADILRLIDLLSGANAYESWLGRRLP